MESINALYKFGEIPIGNSRVRLTNAKNCVKSGLIKDDELPLSVKVEQLKKGKVKILYTFGGDYTNKTAADLENIRRNMGILYWPLACQKR